MEYLSIAALVFSAGSLGVLVGVWGWLQDARQAVDSAGRALRAEREEFAKITEAASKANLSLADKIALNDERLNSLDFLVKTGNARK